MTPPQSSPCDSMCFRWRAPQFGLRGLLLVTAISAIVVHLVSLRLTAIRQEDVRIRSLESRGAYVLRENPRPSADDSLRRIDDSGAKGIADVFQSSSATEVTLVGPGVDDDDLREIAALPQLERLFINDSDISDAGIAQLTSLKHLVELNISYTTATDAAIASLSKLSSLRVLELNATCVTDACIPDLAKLTNLTMVSILHTRVTPAGAERLSQLLPKTEINYVRSPYRACCVQEEQPMKDAAAP